MTRRLLISYLSITAFVLLVLEVPLGISFARSRLENLTADLERDARVLATGVEDTLEGRDGDLPQQVADDYTARIAARVVIVDADGVSVADSESGVPAGDTPRDFSTRPEIAAALRGETASGTRYSSTLDESFVYVAVPVASSGQVFGAIRVTYPRAELDARVRRNWLTLAGLAGVVLAAVAAVGTLLARSVTRPVRALGETAEALARGDLSARAPTTSGPPELRRLATEFNAMAARLQQLVSAQRSFVADASHELRAPLTALRLRLENLESAPEITPDDVRAAIAETSRLSTLVDGLLHLARSEAASSERVVEDAAAVARERIAGWEPFADEQDVRLVAELPPAAPVHVRAGAVAQVLDNFLSNAFDVAPAGSVVTVRVVVAGSTTEVHVVDEGPGLPAEQRARAFDRFWRAPGAPAGGSGLGLAIVAQVVNASGGRATLRAGTDGRGLDAVAVLPSA